MDAQRRLIGGRELYALLSAVIAIAWFVLHENKLSSTLSRLVHIDQHRTLDTVSDFAFQWFYPALFAILGATGLSRRRRHYVIAQRVVSWWMVAFIALPLLFIALAVIQHSVSGFSLFFIAIVIAPICFVCIYVARNKERPDRGLLGLTLLATLPLFLASLVLAPALFLGQATSNAFFAAMWLLHWCWTIQRLATKSLDYDPEVSATAVLLPPEAQA